MSQTDRAPLDLFRETLACGSMRKTGNGGWYWEVNRLSDILSRMIPFFRRFPLVGTKAHDFELFAEAAELLGKDKMADMDYRKVLLLREEINRGGTAATPQRESSETIRRAHQLIWRVR